MGLRNVAPLLESLADDDICAREEARHVEQVINNAVK